jgi:hypothetical protein
MEVIAKYRVPNNEVWFVQAVLTDCEGDAVVSLGEHEADASVISVFYDSTARDELAPLFAYLISAGKIKCIVCGDGQGESDIVGF